MKPRIGLHALGIGPGARRDVIDGVARAAEAAGFARLWAGEHVVMVDRQASHYPYADDGTIPIPADVDWLDPFGCLSFAAAATRTISLATGVLLLPEHNPVLVAKQAATLDTLSGGRFALGVGIGWSREEFDALGVPFGARAARTVEYVAAIRALWREDVASFDGDFVSFDSVRVYPKPPRSRSMPIVFGGNSEPALARAAAHGDGWYGFNLRSAGEAVEYTAALRARRREADRGPTDFEIAVSIVDLEPVSWPISEPRASTNSCWSRSRLRRRRRWPTGSSRWRGGGYPAEAMDRADSGREGDGSIPGWARE